MIPVAASVRALAFGVLCLLTACGGGDPEDTACAPTARGFADPPDSTTVALGSPATFAVVYQREADPNGGGGTVTFEWYRGSGDAPAETGTLLFTQSATTASNVRRSAAGEACVLEYNSALTVPAVAESDDGARFQLRIRDRDDPQFGGGQTIHLANAVTLSVDLLAPRNLQAVAGVDTVALSWQSEPTALRYELERAIGDAGFAPLATIGAPADAHVDRGLTPTTVYRYRLRTVSGARTSAPAEVAVTTLAAPVTSGWIEFAGGPLASGASDPTPSVAVGADRVPAVAYIDFVGGRGQLFVKRHDGSTWQTLGGAALNAASSASASDPSLVIDVEGRPTVAWSEGNGQQQDIHVARFNNATGWQMLGGSGFALNYTSGSIATRPSVALGAGGSPVVAWTENGAVRIKLFAPDGSPLWQAYPGGPGPVSGNAIGVDLFIESGVQPHVAWMEASGGTRALHVARGVDWQLIGPAVGPSGALGLRDTFSLVVDPGSTLTNGASVVAYAQGTRPWSIPRRRFDGTSWVDNFSPADGSGDTELQGLAFNRGASVRALARTTPRIDDPTQSTLEVRVLQGEAGWRTPAPQLVLPSTSTLALATAAINSPVVATVERSGSTHTLRVRRFFP